MNRFNKIIALTFVLAMCAGTASAQFYLGPRAGLNLSNMSTNTAGAENKMVLGFHGGATARYQFSKKLSVQMDALVSTMGTREKIVTTSPGSSITTETTTNIMYTQVPIYINFEKPIMPDNLVPYRVKKSSMSFHLYGGGFFGYGLSATSGTKITSVTDAGTTVTPAVNGTLVSGTYNAIDFGVIAGLGFSFKMDEDNMKRLGLDLRYLLGFSNFSKTQGATATNNAAQVSLMFTQKLTKRKYTNRHQW